MTGWGAGDRQYRYWSYNGLREPVDGQPFSNWPLVSPTEFRVPFEDLAGSTVTVVSGLRGIVSFQVRAVRSGGTSSGNSNVLHQMVGMSGFQTVGPPWSPRRAVLEMDVPLPDPPVTATPLPALAQGSRPGRPAIDEVERLDSPAGTVKLTLAGSYAHDVEYRWWPHSGFPPTAAFDVWYDAGCADRLLQHLRRGARRRRILTITPSRGYSISR